MGGVMGLVKRVGVAGFFFFLAKGMLWLALPAVLYVIRGR